MKTTALIFVLVTGLFLAGCVTPNPDFPAVPNAPAFVPDNASISNAAWNAKQINNATGAFNPYKPVIDLGIDTVATGIAGLAGIIAWLRSRSKNASLVKANDNLDKMLTATTTVIESASNSSELKPQVKELTAVAGVESDLYKRLNK